MKRFRLINALLIMGLLTLVGCADRRGVSAALSDPAGSSSVSPEATKGLQPSAPSFDTQISNAGQVAVELTPLDLDRPEEDTLRFQVAMNTHSVDLDYDLAPLALLRTDTGVEVQASRWDGARGGHHVNGTLFFPTVDLSGAGWFEVVIRDVAGVPERVLRWELLAVPPGTDTSSEAAPLQSARTTH